jgi:phytoene dehydrogenase-like protein
VAKDQTVIIGGGHNSLVAACYLAKAGLKPLVLERRPHIGGTAVTEEIHPGFRCSSVTHSAGPLLPRIAKDLHLKKFGLEMITPEVRLSALDPDGRSLSLYNDPERTTVEIEKYSSADAINYAEFVSSFARIGKLLEPLLYLTPPSIDKPAPGELWNFGKLGLAFYRLGKKDAFRLLRWTPMAVADLVGEWFETELLRATIAARGIFAAFAGPWSAGTSVGLLWQAALEGHAVPATSLPKGGMGALTRALANASAAAGAEIRVETSVEKIQVDEGKATKVILDTGEEIEARVIISGVDPRTTFLRFIDPLDLDPGFLLKMHNYRSLGSVAKINLALSGLPSFSAVKAADAIHKLSGRVHIGPNIEYLERAFDAAKYGDYSPAPYLEVTIPSISDDSLAPNGAHVMSIWVQFAPYELDKSNWLDRREELADRVVKTLSEYAPNLSALIIGRQIITPRDLEQIYGLSGGHIMHGEQSLDQFFTFRPVIGWSQYRTPIKGLYLCGPGTHPGGGITGGPGANASREIIKDLRSHRV